MSNFPPDFNIEPRPVSASAPRGNTPLILGIVGAIVAVGALFCCGGGILLMRFGFDIMTVEVRDALAARPEVRENIGDIESLELNFVRSSTNNDDETFVYDIEGSKGKGFVTVKQQTLDDGSEAILSAELTMSDGRKIPIDFAR